MAVDNLDISSFTGEEESRGLVSKITAEDLLSGKYDFADVEIFLVNYMDLNAGKLVQKRGIIGEVTLKKNMFYAEVRGISQFLSQTLCEKYVPHCRANLGDKRCKFDLQKPGFTVTSTVTQVSNSQSFAAKGLTQSSNWFTGGYVTWLDGKNRCMRMEVKEFVNSTVSLVLPMPSAITEGDQFTIVAGCDKSSSTCMHKFNNIINFRGEPDLPGSDKVSSTAATKSW